MKNKFYIAYIPAILIVTLALLTFIELVLRLIGYYGFIADPYASLVSHTPLFISDGEKLYTAPERTRYFHLQTFNRIKDINTKRIFFLGGSVTYGYLLEEPFKESFPFLFGKMIKDRLGKNAEVINCGGICYASYRLVGIFKEIIEYSPDMIVIFSGNNEFLEPRLYAGILKSDSIIKKTIYKLRIVQLCVDIKTWLNLHILRRNTEDTVLGSEFIEEKFIIRDDYEYSMVINHFYSSISTMAELAYKMKIPLILATIPSNLHAEPFVTIYSSIDRKTFMDYILRIKEFINTQRYYDAIMLIDDVLNREPKAALLYYLKGTVLEKTGKYDEAKENYKKARDLDSFPHRAVSGINNSIREIANKYPRVYCFDAELYFELNSLCGIPGKDLFIDHCHPNRKGHELIAEGLLKIVMDNLML